MTRIASLLLASLVVVVLMISSRVRWNDDGAGLGLGGPPPLPVYTSDMARAAVRPASWTCGDADEVSVDPTSGYKTMFAFVHVYKAAGSTVRDYFRKYADLCGKSWLNLISCTNMSSSEVRSADQNWNHCRVKEFLDGRNRVYENERMGDERLHPRVNNTMLRDDVDIFGGHFRIGTGDHIFGGTSDWAAPSVRYVVFLREPMDRFVSGILYKNARKGGRGVMQLDEVVTLIKKQVRRRREAGEYWSKSLSYLLTPDQVPQFSKMRAMDGPKEQIEATALLAIDNLVRYPVIVGMAENMAGSMRVLSHVLFPHFTSKRRREYAADLFEEFYGEGAASNKTYRNNVSERDGVSTALVLHALKPDDDFMAIFEKYVKYEQMISDFAREMHAMQHAVVRQFQNKAALHSTRY